MSSWLFVCLPGGYADSPPVAWGLRSFGNGPHKISAFAPEKQGLRKIFELLLPGKKISHLKFGPTEQSGLVVQEKKVFFDTICTDADTGEEFIVELQVAEKHSYRDRMLCYATYPIREQLALKLKDRKPLESIDRMDYSLRPMYVISMVYFPFHHDDAAAR